MVIKVKNKELTLVVTWLKISNLIWWNFENLFAKWW
jgi:hypothetical protein